jgi:hypothetical protein
MPLAIGFTRLTYRIRSAKPNASRTIGRILTASEIGRAGKPEELIAACCRHLPRNRRPTRLNRPPCKCCRGWRCWLAQCPGRSDTCSLPSSSGYCRSKEPRWPMRRSRSIRKPSPARRCRKYSTGQSSEPDWSVGRARRSRIVSARRRAVARRRGTVAARTTVLGAARRRIGGSGRSLIAVAGPAALCARRRRSARLGHAAGNTLSARSARRVDRVARRRARQANVGVVRIGCRTIL